MEMDTETSADKGTEAGPFPAVVPAPIESEVCKYFRQGCCRFGTSCRFAHPADSEANSILQVTDAEKPATSVGATVTQQTKQFEANGATSTTSMTTVFDPSKWINAPVFVPQSRMLSDHAYPCKSDMAENEEERRTCEEYVEESESYDRIEDDEVLIDEEENDDGGARGLLSYANIVKFGRSDGGLVSASTSGEQDMEHSFAIQRSRDKVCGICLEVILEKRPREQRFGILPNCKHTFCLSCIRTWRKATNFENKIKRGCPCCRIPSDFVCPSYVWIESVEEKEKVISDYKEACAATDCMHFKKGTARCPFGNKCFYRHALPTGELIDVGAPQRRREPHQRRARRDVVPFDDFFSAYIEERERLHDEFFAFLTEDEDSDLDEIEDLQFDLTERPRRRSSSGTVSVTFVDGIEIITHYAY